MSDLLDRLKAASAAGDELAGEALARIVAMNGEHDALCTERAGTREKIAAVVALKSPSRGWGGLLPSRDFWVDDQAAKALDELAATLPPEDVQTSAQVDVSQVQEVPGTRLLGIKPEEV